MAKAATKERTRKAGAPALTVSGIDHVVLHVTDLGRSRRFYTEILGMTIDHDYPHHLFLGCGKQRVALFTTDDKDGFQAGRDMNHLALNVAGSYEDIVAALRANGITVGGRTGDDRCIYFEDPDGHQIQIVAT
jgi:catechol 2,3-dioxygenase-like lactoylglutathione lyase family enzyme